MLSLAWNLPHIHQKTFLKTFPSSPWLKRMFPHLWEWALFLLLCEHQKYSNSFRRAMPRPMACSYMHDLSSVYLWDTAREWMLWRSQLFSMQVLSSTHLLNSALLASGLSVPFPEPWIFVLCLLLCTIAWNSLP